MSRLHVVFGAGQVGGPLVDALRERGHRVRVVRRSPMSAGSDVQHVRGDAFDRAFCVRAAEGADVVHHCLNVAYSARAWERDLPRLQSNLIEAAARAGARLVVLDNLYMLGRPDGPISASSPVAPCSRKGALRARLGDTLMAAHRSGTVRVVSGRASHLFGPGVAQSQIGEHLFERVLSGRSAQLTGAPGARHSFAYAPDVARALAILGDAPDAALGRAHVLPVVDAMPTEAFLAALFDRLGVAPRTDFLSPLAMRVLGLFVQPLRESVEMDYEWRADYVVDDGAFRQAFGFRATPLDVALAATAAWARERFGAADPASRTGIKATGA